MSDTEKNNACKADYTDRMKTTRSSFTKHEAKAFEKRLALLETNGQNMETVHSKPLNHVSKLNLYELRVKIPKPQRGEWRIIYTFHPAGDPVLLHGGNKTARGKADNWLKPNAEIAEREYYNFLKTDFMDLKKEFLKDKKNQETLKKEISDVGHKIGVPANQVKKDLEQASAKLEKLTKQEWAQNRIAHLKATKEQKQGRGGRSL